MDTVNLCVLAALAVVVFCALATAIKKSFGSVTYPIAGSVTLLGFIGLLRDNLGQRNEWISTILIPYQALFISVLCLTVMLLCIRIWNKVSTQQPTAPSMYPRRRRERRLPIVPPPGGPCKATRRTPFIPRLGRGVDMAHVESRRRPPGGEPARFLAPPPQDAHCCP